MKPLAAICLALFHAGAIAQGVMPMDFDREMRIEIQRHLLMNRVPGCSVAIGQDGKLLYSAGVRWADVEARKAVETTTKFRLGSISKSVTATAAMRLVEQNRISLGTDLLSLVPEFPSKGSSITLEQVLSHRSGVRHYGAMEAEVDRRFWRAADAVKTFASDPLISKTGAKYSYSTHAYTLAAAAVEAATNIAFPDIIRSLVSVPSEAESLACEDVRTVDTRRSKLYSLTPSGAWFLETPVDNSWKYAGGGMEATASDLCRFGMSVLGEKIVGLRGLHAMWTGISETGNGTTYGLGWRMTTGPYGRTAEHGGSQQGCRSYLRVYRDSGIVLVVMTNSADHPIMRLVDRIESKWFSLKN